MQDSINNQNTTKNIANVFILNGNEEHLLFLYNIFKNNDTFIQYLTSLFINSDDGVFDKLFIQVLERRIKSKKIKFFAIRNISLKPEFVGLGLFSSFLSQLEELNINLLFHDVVNK